MRQARVLGGPAVRAAFGGKLSLARWPRRVVPDGQCGVSPPRRRPQLELRDGEVVVLLGNRNTLTHDADVSIVRVVVDVGDAALGEHLEVVTDEAAPQRRIGLCLV